MQTAHFDTSNPSRSTAPDDGRGHTALTDLSAAASLRAHSEGLTPRVANDSDTHFFGERPMDTSAVDGVFEALRHLVSDVFEYRVHIVSKAGPRIATLSREWLARNGVFKDIGIPESNLWFVRKRPEKAPICAQLGITHFVDDRVDVLQHLTTVTHRFLFLGGLGPFTPPRSSPNTVPRSHTWPELVAQIEGTL